MSLRTKIASAAVLMTAIAATSAAQAAPLLFTFGGSSAATFQLDSNPTPLSSSPFSFMTGVTQGTLNSQPYDFNVVTFYSTASAGGLSSRNPGLFAYGPQLFAGTTAGPLFSAGEAFNLSGTSTTLTIAAVGGGPPTDVSEPATWAVLMVGMLGVWRARHLLQSRNGTSL